MSHPYDASMKYLVETRLADWLPLAGRETRARVEVIDSDLSTVSAAADRVLLARDDPPWIFHLELQAGRDDELPFKLPAYNALLHRRHRMVVDTVLVLLRRQADAPELSGLIERGFEGEPPRLTLRYRVVRVWRMPVETFLGGGLGLVPLAPLAVERASSLPEVVRRMRVRIDGEATAAEAATLWTAAQVLLGLNHPPDFVAQLLRGVHGMKESSTYQAIVEEGVEKGVEKGVELGALRDSRELLLLLGTKKFGPPTARTRATIAKIDDLPRLHALCARLLDVATWKELFAAAQ